jgi:hypothetical protein
MGFDKAVHGVLAGQASIDGADRALQHLADRSPMAESRATLGGNQADDAQPID